MELPISNLMQFSIGIFAILLVSGLIFRKNPSRFWAGWEANMIGVGIFLAGFGVSELSHAASINTLLAYESGRGEGASAAFNHLHTLLDPAFTQGWISLTVGATMVAVGLNYLVKRVGEPSKLK